MPVPEVNKRAASANGELGRGNRGEEIDSGRTAGALLTAQKVAELLGVSPEYVWQMSREGRIPTIRLGRARRYRLDSILDWLQEIESTGAPGR